MASSHLEFRLGSQEGRWWCPDSSLGAMRGGFQAALRAGSVPRGETEAHNGAGEAFGLSKPRRGARRAGRC